MTISAIETEYAGCLFRSRLEARWAVFFDRLGIRWEYEPQGYEVGPNKRRYLPDFYLPAHEVWVEVKGAQENLDLSLLKDAVDPKAGLPGSGVYWQKTILILGPIPEPTGAYVHWKIHTVPLRDSTCEHFCLCNDARFSQFMFWRRPVELFPEEFRQLELKYGFGADLVQIGMSSLQPFADDLVTPARDIRVTAHPQVLDAYKTARQARFEHGETPERVTPPPTPRVDHPALDEYVRNTDWYKRGIGRLLPVQTTTVKPPDGEAESDGAA